MVKKEERAKTAHLQSALDFSRCSHRPPKRKLAFLLTVPYLFVPVSVNGEIPGTAGFR